MLEEYEIQTYGDFLLMSDPFVKEDFIGDLALGNEAKKLLLKQAQQLASKLVEENIKFTVEKNKISWEMPFLVKKKYSENVLEILEEITKGGKA